MRSSSETLLDWWKKLEQMLCTFMVLEVWRSCQWVATDVDSITKEARMFTSEQDFKEDLHWLLNQEVMVLRESQPIWSLKFWSLWFILALVSGEIKHRTSLELCSDLVALPSLVRRHIQGCLQQLEKVRWLTVLGAWTAKGKVVHVEEANQTLTGLFL